MLIFTKEHTLKDLQENIKTTEIIKVDEKIKEEQLKNHHKVGRLFVATDNSFASRGLNFRGNFVLILDAQFATYRDLDQARCRVGRQGDNFQRFTTQKQLIDTDESMKYLQSLKKSEDEFAEK